MKRAPILHFDYACLSRLSSLLSLIWHLMLYTFCPGALSGTLGFFSAVSALLVMHLLFGNSQVVATVRLERVQVCEGQAASDERSCAVLKHPKP